MYSRTISNGRTERGRNETKNISENRFVNVIILSCFDAKTNIFLAPNQWAIDGKVFRVCVFVGRQFCQIPTKNAVESLLIHSIETATVWSSKSSLLSLMCHMCGEQVYLP